MPCRVLVNGRPCRAAPLTDRPYCTAHRFHQAAAATIALVDLWRLAEEFDQRSAEAGEHYPAVAFVSWVKPEIDGLEG